MKTLDDLIIYNKALDLVKKIYQLINSNPILKIDYSLCDQIKRASVSVVANISEGYFRSRKQTKNYLEIASGSANETVTLLKIIFMVYQIDTKGLQNEYIILGKQINSFSKSF
ncbi:MAG: S23 ribosomal protein [uncultured bacterium]|nr:MAG: S23 ribosomal protein [uncultured bacterium]